MLAPLTLTVCLLLSSSLNISAEFTFFLLCFLELEHTFTDKSANITLLIYLVKAVGLLKCNVCG